MSLERSTKLRIPRTLRILRAPGRVRTLRPKMTGGLAQFLPDIIAIDHVARKMIADTAIATELESAVGPAQDPIEENEANQDIDQIVEIAVVPEIATGHLRETGTFTDPASETEVVLAYGLTEIGLREAARVTGTNLTIESEAVLGVEKTGTSVTGVARVFALTDGMIAVIGRAHLGRELKELGHACLEVGPARDR